MKILKLALRIILQMKAYSAICIVSLVISLAGTITLVRYIHQELTVDSYLEDLDRIHLLTDSSISSESPRPTVNWNWNNDAHFIDPLAHPAVDTFTVVYVMPNGEVANDGKHFVARTVGGRFSLPSNDAP